MDDRPLTIVHRPSSDLRFTRPFDCRFDTVRAANNGGTPVRDGKTSKATAEKKATKPAKTSKAAAEKKATKAAKTPAAKKATKTTKTTTASKTRKTEKK